ncbi:hypothetical protein JTF06_13770 [Desemzia sp. RIT804]|uniref:hypothetical protein n=1 Tax=Desemzia sp. RIT 804 TaxID=2810209 RepID=UPI0019509371|nr:hypothetical protein [Desemzia sp. RIT 804]MBM6615955.1 hypothetical protein [Desemzia sp. RIT 804]
MDSQTFIRELKLFLRENKKTFIYSVIIFFILGTLLQIGLSLFSSNGSEVANEDNISVTPAAFEVYIENSQTGEPYTNSYIVEEFFEKSEWMDWAEENSGVEISSVVEEFRDEHPEIINGDLLKPITSNRDRSSHVFTVRFNFGDGEENLAITEAYFELLMSEQLEFLQNKNIYTISEPALVEEEGNTTISSVTENGSTSFSVKNIIIILAASLIGGTLLGFVITIMRYLFSEKIYYGFSYSWNEEDLYINLPNDNLYKNISPIILQPLSSSKVILSEKVYDELENQIKEKVKNVVVNNKTHLYFEKDVLDIDPSLQVDEFIIIIKRTETTKNWYNKQREYLKNYPLSLVKVVQN